MDSYACCRGLVITQLTAELHYCSNIALVTRSFDLLTAWAAKTVLCLQQFSCGAPLSITV